MDKVKAFFSSLAEMFGFKKSTKYVSKYLHRANMRSAIFMGGIIVILEIWLVLRQHNEYIFDLTRENGHYLKNVFDYTSLFWLNMSMGASMVAYSTFYLKNKRPNLIFSVEIVQLNMLQIKKHILAEIKDLLHLQGAVIC